MAVIAVSGSDVFMRASRWMRRKGRARRQVIADQPALKKAGAEDSLSAISC
jgi:hypothetical protein